MNSFRLFVENGLKNSPSTDISYYALTQMADEMKERGIDNLDVTAVRTWVAHMLLGGMKASTCRRYIGKIHSLYQEWSRGGEDPFAEISGLINSDYEMRNEDALHNLSLLPRLFAKNESSADYMLVSILLYMLYQPAATIEDVIELKFDTVDRMCPQVDDIIASQHRGNGRKYVFALKQGKTTLARTVQDLSCKLSELMRMVGMRVSHGNVRDALSSIWIAAALKAGVTPEEIRAVVYRIPVDYRVLTLLPQHEVTVTERDRILGRVADTLNDNATHWYAMRLRAGVDTDNVTERINETLPGRLETMEFFCPTRNIIRKKGRRIIKEKVPCVPGLVFFKARANRVRSLFAKIGDLAWCYRSGNRADSPYSIIPSREMMRFQRCVGQFTDDIRMELYDGDVNLARGRMVRVIGGIMDGYEGEITDVEGEPGNRVFTLRISDTVRANWIAHVEDYYIEAI